MAISKIILNGTTQIDVTDTTAVAEDVAQGKYFYGADGIKTAGTATGDEKLIEFIGSMKTLGADALAGVVLLEKTNFTAVTSVGSSALKNAIGGKIIVFPSLTTISNYCFGTNADVETYDFGVSTPNFTAWLFSGDRALKTIIIRKSTVVTAANINVFNATCFASGGTGGTLYVPQSLISSYESATNWSTILGYANNSIKSIESTHTDPNAPIDLTLYYADGTPIQ